MKQVIYIWNYTEWGGAQIYFLSIIKNAPRDWQFTVILPRDSKPEIIEFFKRHGAEFDFLDFKIELEARTTAEKLTRQWKRIVSEINVYKTLLKYNLKKSVVHIEAAPWQSWILLFFLTLRTNVFVTMHNGLPQNISGWRKKLWQTRLNFLFSRRNFHLFAANQNAIDSLKKFIKLKYQGKPVLTRASINVDEIEEITTLELNRDEMRRNFDLPAEKFIVLCVGQFIDRKGRWTFLESVKEISRINRDIFFVWLTQQMPGADERKKIADYQVENSFRLILSKSVSAKHDEILRFFRLFDAFALPSFWEGLPIAVLEAMALGVPTISTRINAIPEAVIDLETGILIEAGSAEQLSAAILKLYGDEKLRNDLAENGRQFVLENFDERIAGRIVIENYEKCLAN